jgi:carbon storage regulator
MLVLQRKVHERLYLRDDATGEEIVIAVTDLDRGRVKIGIDAPKRFTIYRHEIDPKRGNNPEATP